MSGTFPISPGYANISLTSNQSVVVSKSESKKRQARLVGGHDWLLTVSYDPMPRHEFSPIDAFVMLQDGQYDSFDFVWHSANQGTWKDSVTCETSATAVAGDESVDLTVDPSVTIIAGDIFRFADHNKVYKVTADATADGAGAVTVNFKPQLIASVASAESVTKDDVPFHVAIVDVHQVKLQAPQIYKYSVDLEEAL